MHRELEVLSEQYSQKCLENTHLTRTIESEREAMSSTQRENQELRTHNLVNACVHKKYAYSYSHYFAAYLTYCMFVSKELNECLAAELSLMHSRMNGEVKHSRSSQEKGIYQLEVQLDTLSRGEVPKFHTRAVTYTTKISRAWLI